MNKNKVINAVEEEFEDSNQPFWNEIPPALLNKNTMADDDDDEEDPEINFLRMPQFRLDERRNKFI